MAIKGIDYSRAQQSVAAEIAKRRKILIAMDERETAAQREAAAVSRRYMAQWHEDNPRTEEETEAKEGGSDLYSLVTLDQNDWDVIVRQCEIQHATSDEEIVNFALAYAAAKSFMNIHSRNEDGSVDWYDLEGFLIELAQTIYPNKNKIGYRQVFVMVGGRTCPDPLTVPRQMKNLCEAIVEGRLTDPVKAYYEFELIHPFIDGNGRVGHLLWAMMTTAEQYRWPYSLPPNVFGDPRLPIYTP